MGAFIKGISVAYKDNKAPIQIAVRYSDNGYTDSIVKKLETKQEAENWLKMWDGDTSGGFNHLIAAHKVVNNLSE